MNSRKFLSLIIPALLLPTFCSMQAYAGTPYWKNNHVTTVNGEAQRTELIFYPDEEQATDMSFEESPYYCSLNGIWKFRYYGSQTQMPDDIQASDTSDTASWADIKVPGNWDLQGEGTAIYVNQKFEFATMNPAPPALPEDTPAGVYFRTFTIPAGWDGRTVYLNICGAKSGVYVYVNSHELGYENDSKSLVRYDITQYLKKGENNLLIKIYRWSTGSYLECMDFWRISGIERDVYLSSEKNGSNFDFEVVSTLDDGMKDGIFSLRITGGTDMLKKFSYKLEDKDGRVVSSGTRAVSDVAEFRDTVPEVRKWTAETPELYRLVMCMDGEYTRFDVGFRRFEIADWTEDNNVSGRQWKVLLVNGEPVSLHSVEFETYPNGMPKQYHTLLDFEEGIRELCVNHPLRHEGVTYYQMSYDRDPETGIQRTHLTLRSDPGARVVMIGYALLVLAAFGLALRETVR